MATVEWSVLDDHRQRDYLEAYDALKKILVVSAQYLYVTVDLNDANDETRMAAE